MWPWEHAIVGYLAYSVWCHLYHRDAPGGLEAVAVAVSSLLPDLIDKPLAWEWSVFESGYAVGHSVFLAVPLSIAVGLLARSVGRTRAGIAFAIGYLLHPPADVLNHYAVNGVVQPALALWPLRSAPGSAPEAGFLEHTDRLLGAYREGLVVGDVSTHRWAQLAVAVTALALWLYDGAPVLRELIVGGRRVFRRAVWRAIR